MDITFIVWTLLTGIGAAIVYLWYQRRFVGDFVRKLLTIDAVSPETAVTIEELHCKMTPPLMLALREEGTLYEAVLKTEDDPPRYYVAEGKREMLKAKYKSESVSFFGVVLGICILVVIGIVFTALYPVLSEYLGGLLSAE
jgi:hypothetical protein